MSRAAIILLVLLAGCAEHVPEPKPKDWPSEVQGNAVIVVYTDPKSGCEYIGYHRGGITPRMGADGRQVCRRQP